MRCTVKQVADLTGVTVRTLHHYDSIGLLKPSEITDSGYRIYNQQDLELLQQILFFRELNFPLDQIKQIVHNPNFDKKSALEQHKQLLRLKRNRLDDLIKLVDESIKGEIKMSFKEFDMTEIKKAQEKYAAEAEQRWGDTDAYKQSIKRTNNYSEQDWQMLSKEADLIYRGFVDNMDKPPQSEPVQKLVADWQNHITKYFYDCTDEILAGLGQMYVQDQRFTKNIDKYAKGLAQFMSQAIEHYCCK